MNFHEQKRRDYAWLGQALKDWFPWLGTDESVDGADVIDKLNELHQYATAVAAESVPTVRPADEVHDGMMTKELFDKIMEDAG